MLHSRNPLFWIIVAVVFLSVVVAVCLMVSPASDADVTEADMTAIATNENVRETDTAILIAEKWAQAFCGGDGTTIVSMASPEVVGQFEDMGMLEHRDDNSDFSFGSSPMLVWPDETSPYQMVSQDAENHTIDIIYYVWTSEPHVSVWREQIVLEPDADSYIVSKEKLTCMDDISTAAEFLSAYPLGIRDTPMCYYEGNDMGEALNNNALLSSGNDYKDLFDPVTAACDLLNIGNIENMHTELETSGDIDACGVKIHFPDGIIDISMCRPFGENGIWVPYNYSAENN